MMLLEYPNRQTFRYQNRLWLQHRSFLYAGLRASIFSLFYKVLFLLDNAIHTNLLIRTTSDSYIPAYKTVSCFFISVRLKQCRNFRLGLY